MFFHLLPVLVWEWLWYAVSHKGKVLFPHSASKIWSQDVSWTVSPSVCLEFYTCKWQHIENRKLKQISEFFLKIGIITVHLIFIVFPCLKIWQPTYVCVRWSHFHLFHRLAAWVWDAEKPNILESQICPNAIYKKQNIKYMP